MKNRFKRTSGNESALFLIEILLILAIFVTLITSFKNLDTDASRKGALQLETSIRRSAVACYASEGVYPPDIEYLENNYGLQIDHNRYIVRYRIFAENLMPDITVIEINND